MVEHYKTDLKYIITILSYLSPHKFLLSNIELILN